MSEGFWLAYVLKIPAERFPKDWFVNVPIEAGVRIEADKDDPS